MFVPLPAYPVHTPVDVFLAYEPLASAQFARETGWRDVDQA
jgi:hypothetical protein